MGAPEGGWDIRRQEVQSPRMVHCGWMCTALSPQGKWRCDVLTVIVSLNSRVRGGISVAMLPGFSLVLNQTGKKYDHLGSVYTLSTYTRAIC